MTTTPPIARPHSPAVTRFWAKVNKRSEDHCWEWLAHRNSSGYGRMRWHGKMWLAHRVSWLVNRGPIPDGMRVLHHCDNPGCVRPDHLFLGTQADNHNDMKTKGRGIGGARNGMATLDEFTVRVIRRLYRRGLSSYLLARVFGVNHSTTWGIGSGKAWRNVA